MCIRDRFTVFADDRTAHLIPRSALILDEKGRISVRTLDDNKTVQTKLVTLLGEKTDGVLVDGLDGQVSLITLGQDFVSDGQQVTIGKRGNDQSPETRAAKQ